MKNQPSPWRDSCEITPFIDGETFFPALLEACEQAKFSIHIALYWFETGKVADLFIETLIQACGKGVKVTCLLDELGSFSLNIVDRQRLHNAGIILAFYNPIRFERLHLILQRDHSKLFIIDNHMLFIGGAGIADIFAPATTDATTEVAAKVATPASPRIHWRENMFQLAGPIAIDALKGLQRKWQDKKVMFYDQRRQHIESTLFSYRPASVNTRCDRTALCRWLESKGHTQRQILKTVIRQIKRSSKRVILVTAYFAPEPRLRLALKKAVTRGVQVTIVLPGAASDHPLLQRAGQYYYEKLLQAGVIIYEYAPCFMHSKIVICDDRVYFGSSNLDKYTQRWSLEANIEVLDPEFAHSMQTMVNEDIANSEEIKLDTWANRHWRSKLINLIAYKIGCWGDFLARQLLLIQRLSKH